MDAELEFAIQPTTTGKQLFDQVGQNPLSVAFYFHPSFHTPFLPLGVTHPLFIIADNQQPTPFLTFSEGWICTDWLTDSL